jgi:N-acetylglutamate synthase-like GNAT family acetyltransferase
VTGRLWYPARATGERAVEAQIRRATLGDATALTEIIRQSYRDVAGRFRLDPENCPTHPSNCERDWIESDLSRGVSYFILSSGGVACGCVAVERASAELSYLERLGVLPDRRKAGLGRQLVECALREARSSGAGAVSIGIIAEHSELRDWYRRLGFIETGTRRFDHLPFEVAFLRYEL